MKFSLVVSILLIFFGFILGSVVGLLSEVTFGTALRRGLIVSLILGALGYIISSLISQTIPEFSKLSFGPSSDGEDEPPSTVDYVLPQEIPGDVMEDLEKRLEETEEEEAPMVQEAEKEVGEEVAADTNDPTNDPQKMLSAMRAMIAQDSNDESTGGS